MVIPKSCDIVIAGGGPSGSLTAIYLADKGYDVVLLERAAHPRDKVGESLIPDFWKYTDLAGASEKIIDEGFLKKAGAVVDWNGRVRGHTFGDFGYRRPAMHVERDRFDQILFEHARSVGVQTFEHVNVTGATIRDTGETGRERVTVEYRAENGPGSIECRYIVDATGQAAVLGRQFDLRHMDDAFRYLSVWGYWRNSRFVSLDGSVHDFSELGKVDPVTYVSSLDQAGDQGWSWHISLRESASVGLVLPLDLVKTMRGPGQSWEEFFVDRCLKTRVLGRLLSDAEFITGSVSSIRDYSYGSSRLAGPGFFLAGDAAGFVDPIFSVGVVLAMFGAAAAAWGVHQAMSRPDTADWTYGMFNRQLQGRLEVARSLALPQYARDGDVSDLAKTAFALERSAVKEIMYVVSELTTRSDNWLDMVGAEAGDFPEEHVRVIDEIDA